MTVRRPAYLLTGLLCLLLCSGSIPAVTATAAVIHVPLDQLTIQAGIDVAVSGDTVLVANGVYTGDGNRDISFGGKDITVRSVNGPAACIIDCQGEAGDPHRGFHLSSGETSLSLIEGFTIRNGYVVGASPDGSGGGILLMDGAEATIRNNRIEDCHADLAGGGLTKIGDSTPLVAGNTITRCDAANGGGVRIDYGASFRDNLITDNTALNRGGGLSVWSVDLQNDRIIGNHAAEGGGMAVDGYGGIQVANILVAGNQASIEGGGIWTYDYTLIELANCTVAGNSAGQSGGGFYVDALTSGWFWFTDCIVWGNTPDSIGGIVPVESTEITHTDIEGGWPGAGNINADPLFISGLLGDWYLGQTAAGQPADSPCLDAGSGSAATTCYDLVGDPTCMDTLTTRTDQELDGGTVDLGFHYPEAGTVSAGLTCSPSTGTVPFSTMVEATLENRCQDQTRRIAGRIDIRLSGGASYGNWRSGYTNVAAGSSTPISWSQDIPSLVTVLGYNLLVLVAEDITPPPWNLPPWHPAGDTDMESCTVRGLRP